MTDGIIDSKSNQLYSVIEETECQIREEVKTVNDRMRRRKTGAYTAYVKHASIRAPATLPNIQIDIRAAQNDPGAN